MCTLTCAAVDHDVAKTTLKTFNTELNQEQNTAVQMALTHPFTCIQGPPGTGKTRTIVELAKKFVSLNSGKRRRQVMICGPSNKSVDVIARKSKCLFS